MPPQHRGPIAEDTAKRPRAQGPIYHNYLALKASNLESAKAAGIHSDYEEDDLEFADPKLMYIVKLRHEGHATAAGSGQRRKQYCKEFKLASITYWQEQSQPFPGPELSKYKIAKKLQISEKMLQDWIAKEETIVGMHTKQKWATTGRAAQHPDIEDYLHTKFLNIRETGAKVTRTWFIAEAKQWFETQFSDKVFTNGLGVKTFAEFQFSCAWFQGFKKRKGISLRRITN